MSIEDDKVPKEFIYDPSSMPPKCELVIGDEVIEYQKSELPSGIKVFGTGRTYAYYRPVRRQVVVGFEGDMDLAPD